MTAREQVEVFFQIWGLAILLALQFVGLPEPSTYAALLGLAALGFAAYRRRHRQAA